MARIDYKWKCCLWTAILLTICPVLQLSCNVEAVPLKILGLFPHPGKSHFYFFQPILRELAGRGHDVTVISPFPDKNPPKGYHDLTLPGVPVSDSLDIKVSANILFQMIIIDKVTYDRFLFIFMTQ